jgi:hypothetical protein
MTIRSVSEARHTLRRHQWMLDAVDQADADGKPFSSAHRLWLMNRIVELRLFLEQARKQVTAA